MWSSSCVSDKTTTKNEENEQEYNVFIKEEDHIKSVRSNRINMAVRRNLLPYSKQTPQNRQELIQSIRRDREVLGAYFQRLTWNRERDKSPTAPKVSNHPILQRNSYDLFFESACVSVKGLPPKLAAEAKSRISQIITEFEIRAISEMEAQHSRQTQGRPIMDSESGIVYEFHPCS